MTPTAALSADKVAAPMLGDPETWVETDDGFILDYGDAYDPTDELSSKCSMRFDEFSLTEHVGYTVVSHPAVDDEYRTRVISAVTTLWRDSELVAEEVDHLRQIRLLHFSPPANDPPFITDGRPLPVGEPLDD